MIREAQKADRQAIGFTLVILGLTSVLAALDSLIRASGAA